MLDYKKIKANTFAFAVGKKTEEHFLQFANPFLRTPFLNAVFR
jgi:hypothetical protein